MKVFEYKICLTFEHNVALQEQINNAGKEGWELVSVTPNYFRNDEHSICSRELFLKREVEPQKTKIVPPKQKPSPVRKGFTE